MRTVATGVICLLMFGAFSLLERYWFTFFGAEQIEGTWPSWFMPTIFTASTLAGIFARSIFEIVNKPNAPITYKEILIQSSAPSKVILSLIVAPIVIGSLYKTVRITDDLILIFVSSFQNGFFWKTILRK